MTLKLLLKKLINFLNRLFPFRKKNPVSIPEYVEDPEKIVRNLYYPKMITKDERKIRSNAFGSPGGVDEVSVIRLDYSSPDFCKQYAKKHQNPANKKNYFGMAVIDAFEVRDLNADVISSPLEGNPAHADIKIGYIKKTGMQFPAEYKFVVDEIAIKARMYKDPDVENKDWTGDVLV